MISFEHAYETVMARARVLEIEEVPLAQAFGRTLAQDVRSDMDMPPFDKSVMDGYACRRADLGKELRVIETIAAGCLPSKTIEARCSAKIMTGAPIPAGADCVVMVEQSEQTGMDTVRFTDIRTRDNICKRGEDVRKGDTVLCRGDRLDAQHLGILAMVGCVNPRVFRRPQVGAIATGDELVEPDATPGASQIRSTNGCQLLAQIESAGACAHYYGIARDTVEDLDRVIKRALSENDVVVLSGGVSMGDLDLVPEVLRNNGVEILFDTVAVKPGKPLTFGVSPQAYCFGMPGNPVSTFVQFEIMLRPFLCKLSGDTKPPRDLHCPLGKELTRDHADRMVWLPVQLRADGTVEPVEYHGSAHITAFRQADGLAVMPVGVTRCEEGTSVRVRLL